MKKLIRAFAALALFAVVLVIVYSIHCRYLTVDVVFYSALWDAAIAAALTAVAVLFIPWFRCFNRFEVTQLIAICILCGYILAISVPTVIDRSLSFYILEKIQQRGGGIRLDRMEDVFTREYVKEHRLVDVRLTEQQESGTIVIENGCVKLTERGVRLAAFSRYFRTHFLPKKRLLMGEYSDDLTDPFRHSEAMSDCGCQ
jgi:hypothetical protein